MKALGLFLILISSLAMAGDKGNGGYSIVCRDNDGPITSAEILDVYEGRILYKRNFAVDQNSVEDLVNVALARVDYWGAFANKLKKEIALIEKNMILIPEGNELELTDDAFPPIKKKGCKFEQLANYTNSGEVLVSQEIFDRLDNVNKAAMFIHEALYSIRRKSVGDTTSQTTRKFTAHLLALNPDTALIERMVSDTLYRPNNMRPCGLEGTVEERMESCSYVKQPHGYMALVMRKADMTEIWIDRHAKILWSDRIPELMDYKRAQAACNSMSSTLAELGPLQWRLPVADEYRSQAFLHHILPNMMRYSTAYWFWSATTKGRSVLTYNGETGEMSYNPFTGSNTGSVRCVANL